MVDRAPGLSVRLKLTLSYAGFLMLAGAVLLVAGYFSLSRGVHPGVIFMVRSHADLLRAFAPIAALVMAHEQYCGGRAQMLFADHDLYIMQRSGFADAPGLVFVLNNSGAWDGRSVHTQWKTRRLTPIAWWGRSDTSKPTDKWTDLNGATDLWAAGRGYAVYVPA